MRWRRRDTQLTATAPPAACSDSPALSPFAAVVLVAFEKAVSAGLGSAVVGSEEASPSPAELLVDVAGSSMGDEPPIDCASFTTSWVFCSAITSCVTAPAGKELRLE
jgi:hypothetical protein